MTAGGSRTGNDVKLVLYSGLGRPFAGYLHFDLTARAVVGGDYLFFTFWKHDTFEVVHTA